MEQILLNIATNARDAMPTGGKLSIKVCPGVLDDSHRIKSGWGTPGEYVCLKVTDTGTGMNEHVLSQVFEPFFTTKGPGVGTGLGMAMIYGLVKQHHGFVDVQSEVGIGTTVTVYFPVSEGEEDAPEAPEAEEPARGGTETILVVEDEIPIRRATKRLLERFGYNVLLAEDGAQALELVQELGAGIHLIISDVLMPKMTGPMLYKAVRELGRDPKFIFVSGYADGGEAGSSIVDASVPFVRKPWVPSDLAKRVREVLDLT